MVLLYRSVDVVVVVVVVWCGYMALTWLPCVWIVVVLR